MSKEYIIIEVESEVDGIDNFETAVCDIADELINHDVLTSVDVTRFMPFFSEEEDWKIKDIKRLLKDGSLLKALDEKIEYFKWFCEETTSQKSCAHWVLKEFERFREDITS